MKRLALILGVVLAVTVAAALMAPEIVRQGVVASAGTVSLSGAVPSAEQKTRAEALAKSVSGARRVVNTLEVRPLQN